MMLWVKFMREFWITQFQYIVFNLINAFCRFIFLNVEASKVMVLEKKVKGHVEKLLRLITGGLGGNVGSRVSIYIARAYLTRFNKHSLAIYCWHNWKCFICPFKIEDSGIPRYCQATLWTWPFNWSTRQYHSCSDGYVQCGACSGWKPSYTTSRPFLTIL